MPEKDFELVKYERDREHELALNEYTHNLEVEQLKLLILLNGGAATAFLTFADHEAAAGAWLMLPVLLWLAGLFVGAQATLRMRKAQSAFSKFYRHRRHATEFRRLPEAGLLPLGISPGELDDLAAAGHRDVARQEKIGPKDAALLHDRLAGMVVRTARADNEKIPSLSRASLYLFLFGAVAAAGVVMAFPPREAAGGTPAERLAPANAPAAPLSPQESRPKASAPAR